MIQVRNLTEGVQERNAFVISAKKFFIVLGVAHYAFFVHVVKKSKETGIINRFFSYFVQRIHFKARSSGCTNT